MYVGTVPNELGSNISGFDKIVWEKKRHDGTSKS